MLSFYPTDLKPDQAFHAPFTFTITLSVGICTKKTVSKVEEGVVPFRLHLLLMKCTCVGFSGIYDLLLCVSAVEHLRSTIYKSGPWCRDVLEVRGAGTPGVTNPWLYNSYQYPIFTYNDLKLQECIFILNMTWLRLLPLSPRVCNAREVNALEAILPPGSAKGPCYAPHTVSSKRGSRALSLPQHLKSVQALIPASFSAFFLQIYSYL